MKYSPSSGNFYPGNIPYPDGLPSDVIDVGEEDFYAAMARPPGSSFGFEDGKLVIVAPQEKVWSLEEAKAVALKAVNERCAQELAGVRAGYPDDEVQSWPKQEAEARAYGTSPTPLLSALSAARGIDLEELATKVIAKANVFASISGTIIGTRQACEDAIDAATTVEEAQAVVWPL